MRIFNRYYCSSDLVLLLGDALVSFAATLIVRATMISVGFSADERWPLWISQGVVMATIVVISFYYVDLYAIDQALSGRELLLRFMNGFGVACIAIGIVTYPIPELGFRAIYFSEMILMGLCLYSWRLQFMRIIRRAPQSGKVLIFGLQSIGKLVAEQLCQQRILGIEVVGFVADSIGQVTLSYGNPKKVEIPIFAPSSLTELVENARINRILLAGAGSFPPSYNKELVSIRAMGVPIEYCHSFYERLASKIAIVDLPPEWIALSDGFRRDRLVLAAKRTIDVVVSFVGLLLSVPLAILATIAIKIDSPGPIFYRQERVGQNETRFTLYKFRSMTQNAEDEFGPVWASENDPRATRVGAILRKLRIDEIPQMLNVLKGEMSFVGPRPERPYFVERLKENIPYYDLRHSVKPGITGWAQICYRYGDSEQDAVEKLQYDLYYIKHMSPVFDLQIIFESFKVILFGSGAR
jgi:sugar transferase (PEP-CTERM system associated)